MSIDLSQFVTADGTALQGTLTIQLAGGSTALTADSFILGEDSFMDYMRHEDYLFEALRVPYEPV